MLFHGGEFGCVMIRGDVCDQRLPKRRNLKESDGKNTEQCIKAECDDCFHLNPKQPARRTADGSAPRKFMSSTCKRK